MLLENVRWKSQSSRKTTFSSLKINDFKADFEECTFPKIWGREFEICSNLIFCSQNLHGTLFARATTPAASLNSLFEKCFVIFCFFWTLNFSSCDFKHHVRKKCWLKVNRCWISQNHKNGTQEAFFRKLPHCFFGVILSLCILIKHRKHQKYKSKIFSNFWGRKSYHIEGATLTRPFFP